MPSREPRETICYLLRVVWDGSRRDVVGIRAMFGVGGQLGGTEEAVHGSTAFRTEYG